MTTTTAPIGIAPAASASRWPGAAGGFSVAFVAALIAFGFHAPFLALGIPAATIAGWMLGPKMNAAGRVLGMGVAMGVVTVAAADALVVAASAASSVAIGGSGPLAVIGGSIVFWTVGFVVFGLPMMVITVPCGVIWAVLVRALARDGAREASVPESDRWAA